MPRKTKDPKLIALLDKREAAQADFERWYGRHVRAFNRMEKARQRLKRLQKQIHNYEAPKPKET